MTMLPDFSAVKTAMPAVMDMASKHLTKTTDLNLNVLHVGFQKYVGDEATTAAQVMTRLICHSFVGRLIDGLIDG